MSARAQSKEPADQRATKVEGLENVFGVFFKHAKSVLLPGSEQAVAANVSATPSNSLRLT